MPKSANLFFKIKFGNLMLKVGLPKFYLIWLAMLFLVLCICEAIGLTLKQNFQIFQYIQCNFIVEQPVVKATKCMRVRDFILT